MCHLRYHANSRVHCVLGNVSLHSAIIHAFAIAQFLKRASEFTHLRSGTPCAADDLTHTTHRLRIGADDGDRAHIMQNVFSGDRFGANARLGKCKVLGDRFVEMMTYLDGKCQQNSTTTAVYMALTMSIWAINIMKI